jgi:hypothetical protein
MRKARFLGRFREREKGLEPSTSTLARDGNEHLRAAGPLPFAPRQLVDAVALRTTVVDAPGDEPARSTPAPTAPRCVTCFDAAGMVIKEGCDGAPVSVGPSPIVECHAEKGATPDEECKVCTDASGKEVQRSCHKPGPAPAPTPAPIAKCVEEKSATAGEVCKVCYDASGKEVQRSCYEPVAPAPPPPLPQPAVRCEDVKSGDLVCKVCYDAKGTPVSKDCMK